MLVSRILTLSGRTKEVVEGFLDDVFFVRGSPHARQLLASHSYQARAITFPDPLRGCGVSVLYAFNPERDGIAVGEVDFCSSRRPVQWETCQ